MAGIRPAASEQRSANELRPQRLDDVVGQNNAKALMRAAIDSAFSRQRPLDHTLLVGPGGTGKSTFSHVIANELGTRCFDVEAPVSFDTLAKLRETMYDGDILKIEEIHQQGIMERRGRGAATQPEVLYAVMEDRVLPTPTGLLPFPRITIIGTTTDEGTLPDSFIDRFPLRPRLTEYSRDDMRTIAIGNAKALGLRITHGAVDIFADASRGVPRVVNNYVKNALILTPAGQLCDRDRAREALGALGVAHDGLTADMQAMLAFIYECGAQQLRAGLRFQASVSSIATGIGKSRDSKAITLRVEPYLIRRGFLQVIAGAGRRLTDAGVQRAREILAERLEAA